MEFAFIQDLDEYFCEAYANYDKVCLLPGYVMPKMQQTKTDAFGDLVAYTLPANTMRLALQEKKAEMLQALKEKMVDIEFSFSFTPLSLGKRVKQLFSKKKYYRRLTQALTKVSVTPQEAGKRLSVDEKIWQKIVDGAYLPTKNLLFSLALTCNMEYADVKELLTGIGEGFDYTKVRDTVVAYLLFKKITNPDMIKAALGEYKVCNLFLKEA